MQTRVIKNLQRRLTFSGLLEITLALYCNVYHKPQRDIVDRKKKGPFDERYEHVLIEREN